MNLLLDTHVALWAVTDSPKLSRAARDILLNASATVWVSAASVWEIAIKHSLGKGDMPVSAADAANYFSESGFKFLAITSAHATTVENLPLHHHDPFDRMLVAQALSEPLTLVTHDLVVARYSDSIVRI